ncbi:DUF427 domain-containing protein [Primorskyibacter sp. S187A]|uniref:DUF427 domain-containing protein n=1 Tax=Primorskyibacter sp. S187A TaxID=3415130 RepID=UPI003C7E20B0
MTTIRIVKAAGKWTVRAGGAVIAETTHALELSEGDLAPVIYFPRGDVAMAFLEPSATTRTCPYKGDAQYFSIEAKNRTLTDAVWSFEAPKEAAARIAGHLAFTPGDYLTVEQA